MQSLPQFLPIFYSLKYFWGMRKLFPILLALLSVCSAIEAKKTQKKKKAATQKVQPVLVEKNTNPANTLRLCDAVYPQPAWFIAHPSGFTFPANFQSPADYRILTTIDSSWKNYLKSVPYENSRMQLTLPLFMDGTVQCRDFIITRVETMDSALQAKYPDLMTFKASTVTNGLNTARIECDASSIKISITYDGKGYYIHPVEWNQRMYYVCYAKDDRNFVKQKFER